MVKKCSNVGCTKNGDLTCSKCGNAQYCSKECQVGHWSIHSSTCYQKTADSKIQVDSLSIKQLKYVLRAKISSLPVKDADELREKESKVAEKEALAALVAAELSQSEVKAHLAAYAQEKNAPAQSSSATKAPRKKPSQQQADQQLEELKRATPEQLRKQAQMFRQDPDRLRRGNPQMAHMSNAEIVASADQMEMLANNPDMLRDYIREMERLTPEEREMAAKITPEQREAIKNLTPAQKEQMQKMNSLGAEQRGDMMKFQQGLNGTIDEEWTQAVLRLLANKKGEAFKVLCKSMFELADEQVDPWVEMVANMDEWSVRLLCRLLRLIQYVGRPAAAAYQVLDKYSYGMAKHILLLVVGISLYYGLILTWRVLKLVYALLFASIYNASAIVNSVASSSGGGGGATDGAPSAVDPALHATNEFLKNNGGDDFDF